MTPEDCALKIIRVIQADQPLAWSEPLHNAIADIIRQAENGALEKAAQIARDRPSWWNRPLSDAIRALQHEVPA